jgi:hypothetical protein
MQLIQRTRYLWRYYNEPPCTITVIHMVVCSIGQTTWTQLNVNCVHHIRVTKIQRLNKQCKN